MIDATMTASRTTMATILFSDLVNSTELLQRVGDETAQRVFETHHRLLRDAVTAHGGDEVKWTGDGLMVAFDSATAALRCAIAMQQAARRPAAGERLQIRVGLQVGEALRHDVTDYFGTTVVVASRLCAFAAAGEILCTGVIRSVLPDGSAFDFRDRGELTLKGISTPVAAYEVLYEHDPLAMLTVTPFVGRGEVIRGLAGKLEQARAGHGSLVMLVGEPGIGKTRTAQEFAAYARHKGATVLQGRCYDGEWAPPFSPFVEAIKEYAAATPPESLASTLVADAGILARIVPALHELLPDIAEPPPVPAEGERYRLLEAASNFFAKIAGPVVLMLDDLHWADKGTIAMLQQVARQAPSQALVIVGGYRDVELDRTHPLADALATLRRETNYERVVLKGLAEGDIAELLGLVAESDVPEAFVRAISDETGGNPFFIREVMLHLVDERKIVQEDGRWVSTVSIAEMRIPEGVREVIGRRLSRVGDTCGRMLTVASALTAGFTWEVVVALVDAEDAALLDAVDEALAAQLIVESERGRYDFTHALIRHTLYEELSTPRRVLLHRQIGGALERLYAADIEPHLAELAHHHFESAQPASADKAVDYACRAAVRAEAVGAHDEAATLYERALEASELHQIRDDGARCEMMLSLARAQFHAGDISTGNIDLYVRAAALAQQAGSPELFARAASCDGRVWPTFDERLIPLMEEALASLDPADSSVRARALGYLGLLIAKDDSPRGRALALDGLNMARRLNDLPTEIYVSAWLFLVIDAWDAPYDGWLQEMRDLSSTMLVSAEMANDPEMLRVARYTAIKAAMYLGDVTAATDHLLHHEALSERSRIPQDMHVTSSTRAALALLEGKHDEAERWMEDARGFSDRLPSATQTYLMQLYVLRFQQGRVHEFEDLLRAVSASDGRARLFAAHWASDKGDLEWARRELKDITDHPVEQGGEEQLMLLLGPDVCHAVGDLAGAGRLEKRIKPWSAINFGMGCTIYIGSASRQLGLLAETLGRLDDAERHFEDALAMNIRMGARPWVARTQLDYARMLRKRASDGDVARAQELLAAALATAQEIGMAKVAADCEGLLAGLDAEAATR